MIFPVAFLIIAMVSNHKHKRTTKPITAFIALQGSWMVGFWVYQIIFMWKDGHSGSPILIAFALIFNYIINCIFYSFIKQRLINGKDPLYQQYCVTHGRTQRWILNWSMLTSFQLFRFQYCGLFGR